MAAKPTTFGSFHNGIALSKKIAGGFHSLKSCDIHSQAGAATGSFAFEKTSGTIVDNLPDSSVTLPSGDSFFATSSSGKIWKVTTSGVTSLVHTNTQGVNFGLGYFMGYLYYASATKLGRIAESNASSEATWSSQTDSWATFTNTNVHPIKMEEQNASLFIPNRNYVAAVNSAGVFEAASLDLQSQHSITTCIPAGTGLLIGTWVGNYHNQAGLFLWDTYSPSYIVDSYIDEAGVNAFIRGEMIFIQAGLVGNIYYWSGEKAVLYKRLRDGDTVIVTGINPSGAANLNGLPLFTTRQGIYSLGRGDASLPVAQNIEYVYSATNTITPGAIQVVGGQIFTGWKNFDGVTTTYGIDKLSNNKSYAIITTCQAKGVIKSVKVFYDSIPAGTSISARVNKDNSGFVTHDLVQDDGDERCFRSVVDVMSKSSAQFEITLVSSGSNSPIIDAIVVQ